MNIIRAIQDIYSRLRSVTPIEGEGINIERTPEGAVFSISEEYAGTSAGQASAASPYAGYFRTTIDEGAHDTIGENVLPENDASIIGEWDDIPAAPVLPADDGKCYVLKYCGGEWQFEEIRECDEDEEEEEPSEEEEEEEGGDTPTPVPLPVDVATPTTTPVPNVSLIEGSHILVAAGLVYYGHHVFQTAATKLPVQPGYIYVNWNNDIAKIGFSQILPVPTEYWHCSIVAVVSVDTAGDAPSATIVQQQHGAVVQSLSRAGMLRMVLKNRGV